MEIIPTLSNVDAVITDPPYVTTDLEFDKDCPKFEHELIKITKSNTSMAIFGSINLLARISNTLKYRFSFVWLKNCPVNKFHNCKKPMKKFELGAVYCHPNAKTKDLIFNELKIAGEAYIKKQKNSGYNCNRKDQIDRLNTSGWTKDEYITLNEEYRYQTDVINGNKKQCLPLKERTIHPTQKPKNVIETLILWISNANRLILDPFAGSGTTGIVAKELRRQCILIEKEEKYCEIISKRLQQEVLQLTF